MVPFQKMGAVPNCSVQFSWQESNAAGITLDGFVWSSDTNSAFQFSDLFITDCHPTKSRCKKQIRSVFFLLTTWHYASWYRHMFLGIIQRISNRSIRLPEISIQIMLLWSLICTPSCTVVLAVCLFKSSDMQCTTVIRYPHSTWSCRPWKWQIYHDYIRFQTPVCKQGTALAKRKNLNAVIRITSCSPSPFASLLVDIDA